MRDGSIELTQKVKVARYSEVFESQAPFDPIGIMIVPWAIPLDSGDASYRFTIYISTTTDIWFEQTSIGQENRRRLESFFERVFDNISVFDVSDTSTGQNDQFRDVLPE